MKKSESIQDNVIRITPDSVDGVLMEGDVIVRKDKNGDFVSYCPVEEYVAALDFSKQWIEDITLKTWWNDKA